MFAEWVSAGAIFGIEAFFAVVIFVVCVAAVAGLMAMVGAVIGVSDEKERRE